MTPCVSVVRGGHDPSLANRALNSLESQVCNSYHGKHCWGVAKKTAGVLQMSCCKRVSKVIITDMPGPVIPPLGQSIFYFLFSFIVATQRRTKIFSEKIIAANDRPIIVFYFGGGEVNISKCCFFFLPLLVGGR